MPKPIKKVSKKHLEVAQLKELGYTHAEIASATGYSTHHIKSILANPDLKAVAKGESGPTVAPVEPTKSVDDVIRRAAIKAILLLEQVMNDSSELGDTAPTLKQRIDAAVEILGMAGHGKSVKVNHSHTHLLRPSDFDEIRRRGLGGSENAIEVKATPVAVEALPEFPLN